MFFRSACCLGAAIALSMSTFAQGRPSSPSPNPTGPGVGGNVPGGGRSPFPTTNPNTLPPSQMPQQPIFLSGKVMLDDGTPPPEPVAIQRICNTNPHTEAYTDTKGNFSFQLGQQLGVIPDASEQTWGQPGMGSASPGVGTMGNAGPLGGAGMGRSRDVTTMLMGCTLRAQLPGYRSDSVNLTNHHALDNPDVGVIILHRIGNVEGQTISATSAMAPKDAKKSYEKALNDLKKQKFDDAQKQLDKATEIYPKYAAAWFELGLLQERAKDFDAAKKSYQQALAADPKYLKPYHQLALIAVRDRKWDDVKDTTSRLVRLDPVDYPDAWYYNAVANYELKDYGAAEKSAREGLKVDNDHVVPRTNQLLAVLLAGKEDYQGAAASLKEYLRIAPNGPEADTVKKQLAIVEQKLQGNAPSASAPAPDKQP